MFAADPKQITALLPLQVIVPLTQERRDYTGIPDLAAGMVTSGFWSRLLVARESSRQLPKYLEGINTIFHDRSANHVTKEFEGCKYENAYWPLIAGHRRRLALYWLLAHGSPEWRKRYKGKSPEWVIQNVLLKEFGGMVPCIGFVGISPAAAVDRQLMENNYDPPPVQDATQTTRALWLAKTDLNQGRPPVLAQFARDTGMSESTIRAHLGVFNVTLQVQKAFFEGVISLTAVDYFRAFERKYGYHLASKDPARAEFVEGWKKRHEPPTLNEADGLLVEGEVVSLLRDYMLVQNPKPLQLRVAMDLRLRQLVDSQLTMWETADEGSFFSDQSEQIEAEMRTRVMRSGSAMAYGLLALEGLLQRINFLENQGLLRSSEHPWHARQARERFGQALGLLERTLNSLSDIVDATEIERAERLIDEGRKELARADQILRDPCETSSVFSVPTTHA